MLHIRHTHQQHPFLKTLNWLKYKTFSKNFPSPFFLSLFNTSLWRQKMGRFKVMAFLGRFLIGKNSDFFQRDFRRGMANSFDPDLKSWSFKSSRTVFFILLPLDLWSKRPRLYKLHTTWWIHSKATLLMGWAYSWRTRREISTCQFHLL